MKVFPIEEIFEAARTKAPFYKKLYSALPDYSSLDVLPIVDPTSFWNAHRENRQNILTAPLVGGLVLNSGGTSGNPKFSYVTRSEYSSCMEVSAMAFTSAGLVDGHRVMNLFPSGDLYAAFLTATYSLEKMMPDTLHFPMGFLSSDEFVGQIMADFQITAVAGMPSRLYKLFLSLLEQNVNVELDLILFAGEPFFPDQIRLIQKLFPKAKIRPLGYGSVDGGILGFSDFTCLMGEYRPFSDHLVFEIVDDNGKVINEPDISGHIVITNLLRKLMPIIRYPTGDRAAWIESSGVKYRKFRLLGRGNESARIADLNIYPSDILNAANRGQSHTFSRVQLVVKRFSERDQLTVLFVAEEPPVDEKTIVAHIHSALHTAQPVLAKMIAAGLIAPIEIKIGQTKDLIVNQKTGKALSIADLRMAVQTK
ncbi:phenylacetate-CoA ligase [Verrucomicrobium sp. GAS474]|uniref:phenylacetate--CoA ligase family protein n=1 Tax=Verrucomicrobium sp. GAS474 TaxID=1882831 RepID=UPI000879420D|nr:phenylacetate--CoA ligase family protein [Verrucomicrobium sp. GAS474]SDT93104.1 phenylacetate-CoA ligase [Verrucomicrobium sp. GAS474]